MKDSDSDSENSFDDQLNSAIGQFGRYHVINLLLLAVPAAISACMSGDYIFTAAKLPHRCAVTLCDGPYPEYSPKWILNAIPVTDNGFDDCTRFQYANVKLEDLTSANCSANLFTNKTLQCDHYVYKKTNTVVYDFGLECKEWLRALPGTLNSLGGMISLLIAGFVSDNLGRRISVVVFSFNIALLGFIRAFSVNYPMYVILQFMQTAIGGGAFSASYILATEIVGPKYRTRTSATVSTTFALGEILLGLIAAAIPEWRTLTIVLYTPVFLLVSYYWILTESHRWLISKNKVNRARETLKRAAKLNKKEVTDKTIDRLLTAVPSRNVKSSEDIESDPLLLRVLKSPVLLIRCCTTPIWWITTTFIYYGLSINSVSLSGNIYTNYIATSAIEIPGFWTAVLILDRVGRKTTLFLGYITCAVCCILFAFCSDNYWSSLFLYLTGKLSISLVFTSLYLFTSELYPTSHRHSFLAFSSMMGRVGSVVAPLTPPLRVYWTGIPSLLFGGMAIVSGLLVLTQPETLGRKLPDTLEEAEHIGNNNLVVKT